MVTNTKTWDHSCAVWLRRRRRIARPLENKQPIPLRRSPARLPSKPRLFGRDVWSRNRGEPAGRPTAAYPNSGRSRHRQDDSQSCRVPRSSCRRQIWRHRYFVRCDPATTADALTGEIARTIGLELGPNLEARVFAWLKEAPAVLMLDNAETPWEADTEATERLLTDLSCIPV